MGGEQRTEVAVRQEGYNTTMGEDTRGLWLPSLHAKLCNSLLVLL